jgi:hypothetical protein
MKSLEKRLVQRIKEKASQNAKKCEVLFEKTSQRIKEKASQNAKKMRSLIEKTSQGLAGNRV